MSVEVDDHVKRVDLIEIISERVGANGYVFVVNGVNILGVVNQTNPEARIG